MSVPGRNATPAQHGQHRGVGDAQSCADPRCRPSEIVEVDGLFDLLRRQTAAAHRDAVPMENSADRAPFDPKSIAELVHRRARLVASDQLLGLIGAERSGTSGAVPRGCCRRKGTEPGKLLAELFQVFDLGFRVIISFPNLHPVTTRNFWFFGHAPTKVVSFVNDGAWAGSVLPNCKQLTAPTGSTDGGDCRVRGSCGERGGVLLLRRGSIEAAAFTRRL